MLRKEIRMGLSVEDCELLISNLDYTKIKPFWWCPHYRFKEGQLISSNGFHLYTGMRLT